MYLFPNPSSRCVTEFHIGPEGQADPSGPLTLIISPQTSAENTASICFPCAFYIVYEADETTSGEITDLYRRIMTHWQRVPILQVFSCCKGFSVVSASYSKSLYRESFELDKPISRVLKDQ